MFLHFLSFSFIFFHFLTFSFIFFLFLSFSIIFFQFSLIFFQIFFVFVWCSKPDFFLGLNFVTISFDSSFVKNQFLGPSRVVVGTPLGPLVLFFPIFSCFIYIFFFFFFFFFFNFFIFSEEKVSSFLFSCISFKYFLLLALVSEFNCFPPKSVLHGRCGVLTT